MAFTSIDNDAKVNKLWDAAYKGDVPTLQQLLEDPSYKSLINYNNNSQGHSALFFACYGTGNAEAVRLLLQAGADPFQRDGNGALPLHFAANSLKHGINTALFEIPNMINFIADPATATGQTPLQALFIPNPDVSLTAEEKIAAITNCLPFFLKRDREPLKALHTKDHNGLSALMLVKHYNLQGGFYAFVAAKTFAVLLKSVSVPGNIETLLHNSDFCRHISLEEPAVDTKAEIVNARPRFRYR